MTSLFRHRNASALQNLSNNIISIGSRGLRSKANPMIKKNIPIIPSSISNKPLEIALVKHPYSINGIPLPATTASDDKFAVFSLLGKQFKVTKDDVIVTDKMENIDIGQKLEMNEVALIGSRKATLVGAPLVQGGQVLLEVEEMTKDKKVIIFKSRRRKNSKSKNGFRRLVTILRVVDIVVPKEYSTAL